MIKRRIVEDREYYDPNTGLVTKQKYCREIRLFGILIHQHKYDFNANILNGTNRKSIGLKSE